MKVGEVWVCGADNVRNNAVKGMGVNQASAAKAPGNVSQPAAAKGDSVSFSDDVYDVKDTTSGRLQLPKWMSEKPDANGNVQTRSFM